MKTKHVILEDDPRRIIFFEMFMNTHKLEYAVFNDAKPCMDYITKNKDEIKMIFLDHDLGGEIMVDSSVHNTGFTVARHIKETYQDVYPATIIHSHNPVGAENMRKVLTKAQAVPFYLLKTQMGFG